jgi:HSP90 family molecular chaperone
MTAEQPPLPRHELHQQLSELIVAPGITADRQRLKADLCTQFTDHREYLRELVTNACDAGANKVWITLAEAAGEFTVTVRDNGGGMHRQGVIDYLTLYRSRKSGDPERAIGRHGIGKLSVAAIPDQTRFALTTSTGREAWRLETGNLLADAPITIQPVRPTPRRGSHFAVSYKAQNELAKEVEHYQALLGRYLHHLPLRITLEWPAEQGRQR